MRKCAEGKTSLGADPGFFRNCFSEQSSSLSHPEKCSAGCYDINKVSGGESEKRNTLSSVYCAPGNGAGIRQIPREAAGTEPTWTGLQPLGLPGPHSLALL